MRIISGSLRRRTIHAPKGVAVRPTTDRVRESVFNWLMARFDFTGLEVLDLFAGTGALGFEAISRGAASAVFVEDNRQASAQLQRNARDLDIEDLIDVIHADAPTWLRAQDPGAYDLIFADPPYEFPGLEELPEAALPALRPGGVFLLEHGQPGVFANHPNLLDERRYGRTSVAFFSEAEDL